MDDPSIHPIWQPETGITDLEGDPGELSAPEIPGIKAVWTDQRRRLRGTTQLSAFTEQLSREWAVETGVLENLYEIDRGVTQTLIEHGFQAELLRHGSTNKPRDYVIQLLKDQKDALDGIFDFVKSHRQFSISYIKELHGALLRSQDTTEGLDAQGSSVKIPLIKGDWKKQKNYPVRDGVTYTYCPPEQVGSEMDRLVTLHNQHRNNGVSSEVQAAWLHHRFTQIHPFQDGNGRVARAIASLVLVKDGLFPLVVRQDDRVTYLEALEAADKDNLKPLIDLVVKLQLVQFRKATKIAEILLVKEDTNSALRSLTNRAKSIANDRYETLTNVFELAKIIEDDLDSRLNAIIPDIKDALTQIAETAEAYVLRSNSENDYYFRFQIIENAKDNIGYFADMNEYRSWIALKMHWSRRSQLVFTIHGLGKPFNGSLICAPFLEFKDADNEGQIRSSLVPIAEEGFIFFYNEDQAKLLTRFERWRENVLTTAIEELAQNL